MSSTVTRVYHCDECGRDGLAAADMGKFHPEGPCGVCITCLRKMGIVLGGKLSRGTNRTPPKRRRKKR